MAQTSQSTIRIREQKRIIKNLEDQIKKSRILNHKTELTEVLKEFQKDYPEEDLKELDHEEDQEN